MSTVHCCVDKDVERLALFPNLDYKELYDTLYEFIPGLRAIPSSGLSSEFLFFGGVGLVGGLLTGNALLCRGPLHFFPSSLWLSAESPRISNGIFRRPAI